MKPVELRLQKLLADQGVASRRTIENWIRENRISVDGKLAQLGIKVTYKSKIVIDGKPIRIKPPKEIAQQWLIYYKPEGEVCTARDEEGRRSVFASLPPLKAGRWVMIGRLDLNSSGLIIFTTDGEAANKLMHPSSEIEREYAVRVFGTVHENCLKNLRRGVMLEDGLAKFDNIDTGGGESANRWFYVTLKEGRNREVRRLWESQGIKVSRLVRIRYGTVSLPRKLKPGTWQMLEKHTIKELSELLESPPKKSARNTRVTSAKTPSSSRPSLSPRNKKAPNIVK